jgi:hypothetical protein
MDLEIVKGWRSGGTGFGKGEAFGRDASGQTVKYFAECFAPTAIAIWCRRSLALVQQLVQRLLYLFEWKQLWS